ncbi:MAG: hydroxyacid dehydrogenase [Bacteroidales bacterium]|nr:hydroxyacid dehydrogenase [Bacteroidales bacterium]
MKIVFLDRGTLGQDADLSPIAALGELVCYDETHREQKIERVADADIIITNKVRITKEVIDAAPRLRKICVAATGVNCVDLDYAALKGIPVLNVAGYSTDSVAQLTWMHILNLVCGAFRANKFCHDLSYSNSGCFCGATLPPYHELSGKTIGIIGMGNIGRRVASIALAFGMKVVYHSTSGKPHCSEYPALSLEELLSASDVVSIHCPLNTHTDSLIDYAKLHLMKRSAFLVNMARGGIVVEADLVRALNNKLIAGAACDVYTREPMPENHPYLKELKDKSRLLLSPHIAWASVEARAHLVQGIADNILK